MHNMKQCLQRRQALLERFLSIPDTGRSQVLVLCPDLSVLASAALLECAW